MPRAVLDNKDEQINAGTIEYMYTPEYIYFEAWDFGICRKRPNALNFTIRLMFGTLFIIRQLRSNIAMYLLFSSSKN